VVNTILVGNGYWGSKILEKLNKLSKVIEVQSSNNYNPNVFEKADWVFVSTPFSTHYRIVKDCILKGVNVFVEKPFTNSVEEAFELIQLAREKNVLLYIDNVFLHRSELLEFSSLALNSIKFIWHKFGPFNDSIINDLLYHDLYILISKFGFFPIEKFLVNVYQPDKLIVEFIYSNIKIEIDYNRRIHCIQKSIFIDNISINFLNEYQDPLYEIIFSCLYHKHNFFSNQELNLKTMILFNDIKKHIDLH